MSKNQTPQFLEKVRKLVSERKVLSAEIHSLWGQIVKLRERRATMSANIKGVFTELKAYHTTRRNERVAEKKAAQEARKTKLAAAKLAKQQARDQKKAAKAAAAATPAPAPAA